MKGRPIALVRIRNLWSHEIFQWAHRSIRGWVTLVLETTFFFFTSGVGCECGLYVPDSELESTGWNVGSENPSLSLSLSLKISEIGHRCGFKI